MVGEDLRRPLDFVVANPWKCLAILEAFVVAGLLISSYLGHDSSFVLERASCVVSESPVPGWNIDTAKIVSYSCSESWSCPHDGAYECVWRKT